MAVRKLGDIPSAPAQAPEAPPESRTVRLTVQAMGALLYRSRPSLDLLGRIRWLNGVTQNGQPNEPEVQDALQIALALRAERSCTHIQPLFNTFISDVYSEVRAFEEACFDTPALRDHYNLETQTHFCFIFGYLRGYHQGSLATQRNSNS